MDPMGIGSDWIDHGYIGNIYIYIYIYICIYIYIYILSDIYIYILATYYFGISWISGISGGWD